jgi:hypothetical protein
MLGRMEEAQELREIIAMNDVHFKIGGPDTIMLLILHGAIPDQFWQNTLCTGQKINS